MVAFGETLSRDHVKAWAPHYIDYSGLKEYVESGNCKERGFAKRVRGEKRKVDAFARGKVQELINELQHLEKFATNDPSKLTEQQVDAIGEKIINLDQFSYHNLEGFRKIIKKYKKLTGNSSTLLLDGSASPLHETTAVLHNLIVHLSNIWTLALGTRKTEPWEPPAAFARKTTKYWIRPEDISKLKIFIMKRLPILEMNKSAKVDLDFVMQGLDQTHNFISSVYLDSDEFTSYHQRIRLEEGAQLMRIRWYGGDGQPPQTTGDGFDSSDDEGDAAFNTQFRPGTASHTQRRSLVPRPSEKNPFFFVERKTHHEKWTGEKSVKERFKLRQNVMGEFMEGTLDLTAEFKKMVEENVIKAQSYESSLKLAEECQSLVQTLGLKPKIRTSYHRTAFQLDSSNQVRLSLDFPLYLFRERMPESQEKFWSNIDAPSNLTPFEYGVLEIKIVGDEKVAWVDELLESGWLKPIPKFSKFQHTIATCFPDQVEVNPYWLDNVEVAASNVEESSTDPVQPVASSPEKQQMMASKNGAGGEGEAAFFHTLSSNTAPATISDGQLVRDPGDDPKENAGIHHSKTAAHGTNATDSVLVEMGTSLAPTCPTSSTITREHPVLSANGLRKRAARNKVVPEELSETKVEPPRQNKFALKKTNLVKSKVEPKTYFANERTFIQWLSAALLIITLASGIMTVGYKGQIIGTVFYPVGFGIIAYALGMFHWRRVKISARDGGRFDDSIGPNIIAGALLLAMITTLIFVWIPEPTDTSNSIALWDNHRLLNDSCTLATGRCTSLVPPSGALTSDFNTTTFELGWPAHCFASHAKGTRSLQMMASALTMLRDDSTQYFGCADLQVNMRSLTTLSDQDFMRVCTGSGTCITSRYDSLSDTTRIESASILAGRDSELVGTGSRCNDRYTNGVAPRNYIYSLIGNVNPSDLLPGTAADHSRVAVYRAERAYSVVVAGAPAELRSLAEYSSASERSAGALPTTAFARLTLQPHPAGDPMAIGVLDTAARVIEFLALVRTEATC